MTELIGKSDVLYESGMTLVHERNEFYRVAYQQLLASLLVSIVFNGVMITMTIWLATEPRPPVYFATDPSGRLLRDLPVDEQFLPDQEVKAFAVQAARRITSFDYLNFRRDLQNARVYFTDQGYDNMIAALDRSNNLKTVLQEKLVSRGELAGEVVLKKGRMGDVFVWLAEVPLNIRYESQNLQILQPVTANLLIERVATTESLFAIQAPQIWLEDRIESI